MILTKNNLNEWKAALDKKMLEKQEVENYSKTMTDEYWLNEYTGKDVNDAFIDEVQYWDEER